MTPVNHKLITTIWNALTAKKTGTVTVLSALLQIEDALGYIPSEAIEAVAEFTNSTLNEVWGVASFYTNFRFEPPENHTLEVCWGPSCHLLQGVDLLNHLFHCKNHVDEMRNNFTVKYNTCLGACSQAPVISIDHQLIGKVTPAYLKLLAEGIQSDPMKSRSSS